MSFRKSLRGLIGFLFCAAKYVYNAAMLGVPKCLKPNPGPFHIISRG
jgi:hypothetical protein